jgi:hypothetical protein
MEINHNEQEYNMIFMMVLVGILLMCIEKNRLIDVLSKSSI